MKSRQNAMPCSTKCKVSVFFMVYLTVIASPFGLTVSGYSLGRAAVAAMVLGLISVPVWMKVLRMDDDSSESLAEIEESTNYSAV